MNADYIKSSQLTLLFSLLSLSANSIITILRLAVNVNGKRFLTLGEGAYHRAIEVLVLLVVKVFRAGCATHIRLSEYLEKGAVLQEIKSIILIPTCRLLVLYRTRFRDSSSEGLHISKAITHHNPRR
jgi:hypothetical protein